MHLSGFITYFLPTSNSFGKKDFVEFIAAFEVLNKIKLSKSMKLKGFTHVNIFFVYLFISKVSM
jgi:hypothetical protein